MSHLWSSLHTLHIFTSTPNMQPFPSFLPTSVIYCFPILILLYFFFVPIYIISLSSLVMVLCLFWCFSPKSGPDFSKRRRGGTNFPRAQKEGQNAHWEIWSTVAKWKGGKWICPKNWKMIKGMRKQSESPNSCEIAKGPPGNSEPLTLPKCCSQYACGLGQCQCLMSLNSILKIYNISK